LTPSLALAPPRLILAAGAVLAALLGLALAAGSALTLPELPSGLPSTGASTGSERASLAAAMHPDPQTASPQRAGIDWVQGIMDRNVFDHSKIGGEKAAQAKESASTGEDLGLVLLAVAVTVPQDLSAALIQRDHNGARAFGYAIGDDVHGMKLIDIRANSVVLEKPDGERIVLSPREEEEGSRRRSRRKRKGGKNERIHKVSEHHFEVDSGLLDEVLKHPRGLRKLGSAKPYKRDGKMVGFRLYRIRRGSMARQLGLRSGDIVTAVNGRPLKSTGDAMAMYQTLQTARSLEVDVQRRNGRRKRTIRLDLL